MPATEIISLATDIGTVIAFVYFVLQWEKSRSQSILENHAEWQAWLSDQNENNRSQHTQLNALTIEAMNQNAQLYTQETGRLVAAISHLDNQIDRLTTISLLNYALLNKEDTETAELTNKLFEKTTKETP